MIFRQTFRIITKNWKLIGNVLKPLAKSVLISLGLTVAASATDSAIHKEMFKSGFTTLIVSNEKKEFYDENS